MAEEDPERIPSALLDKPEMPFHMAGVLEAFLELHRSRRMVGGFTQPIYLPIESSEAIAVAKMIGWDPEDFLRVIRPADTLYVDHLNEAKS